MVLEEQPDDFEANLNLGIALWTMEEAEYRNQRDYTQPKAYFQKAAELRSDDPRPHLYLGRMAFDREAYGAAIDHLSTAAGLDPGNESAHQMLGISLIEVGSPDAGVKELQKTLGINPRNQIANLALGKLYESRNRNVLAMKHLEQALTTNPNLDEATYLLERVYYEEGLYRKAEERCLHFLRYHPEDVQSLEILGWTYKIQGRTAEMVEVYGRLARIQPENTGYWSPVIQHYMEDEDYGSAKQALETALRHSPYYAYGNIRYGQVLMHYAEEAVKNGLEEEAVELLALARDHLAQARVDDRYSEAASKLMGQVDNRLRELEGH
jgi:tetratricopeptide (TPR) repeat protein